MTILNKYVKGDIKNANDTIKHLEKVFLPTQLNLTYKKDILEKLKKQIAKNINDKLGGKHVKPSDLAYPPQRDMGDLSLPCFNRQVFGENLSKFFFPCNSRALLSISFTRWSANCLQLSSCISSLSSLRFKRAQMISFIISSFFSCCFSNH